MDALLTSEGILALLTLTFLEIVLGVDNAIFISIVSAKLPPGDQPRARQVGLLAAMMMRILLLPIVWIMHLTAPLFSVLGRDLPGAIRRLVSCSVRPRSRFTNGWRSAKCAIRREPRRRSRPSSSRF